MGSTVFKLVWFLALSCLLLLRDSGNLSLQLSQGRDVAVRVDGLSGFKEIQKDHLFPIPKENAHHYPRRAAS